MFDKLCYTLYKLAIKLQRSRSKLYSLVGAGGRADDFPNRQATHGHSRICGEVDKRAGLDGGAGHPPKEASPSSGG